MVADLSDILLSVHPCRLLSCAAASLPSLSHLVLNSTPRLSNASSALIGDASLLTC